MSIRERLARAACFSDGCCNSPADCDRWQFKTDAVDAILADLQEPSEGMKQAAMELDAIKALDGIVQTAFVHGIRLPDGEPPLWQAYRAMIQHIQRGGS